MNTQPTPLQGLAAYLLSEAGDVFAEHPDRDCLRQWAREVDAASQLATPASPVRVIEVTDADVEAAFNTIVSLGSMVPNIRRALEAFVAGKASPPRLNWSTLVKWWESGAEDWNELKAIVLAMYQQASQTVEPAPMTLTQAINFFTEQERMELCKKFKYSDSLIANMTHAVLQKLAAPTAQPVGTAPNQLAITLDFKQATELLEMFGGELGELTLLAGDGHSGKGIYAYSADYPEEGADYLGVSGDDAASRQPAAVGAVEPQNTGGAA